MIIISLNQIPSSSGNLIEAGLLEYVDCEETEFSKILEKIIQFSVSSQSTY